MKHFCAFLLLFIRVILLVLKLRLHVLCFYLLRYHNVRELVLYT